MKKKQKDLHLVVDVGTADVVRGAAARLGYKSETGHTIGKGNLSALLRSLAHGEVDPSALSDALEAERKLVNLEGEKDE